MAEYTPIEEVTYSDIPLTGVLIPGATVGYVAESKFIKGGYIVVKTLEERDALLDKSIYEDKEITIGTPVFVSDENKTYRYAGEDTVWEEDTTPVDILSLQSSVSELQTELSTKASADDLSALSDTITAINANVSNVELNVTAIGNNITSLQEQVDKNTSDIAQRVDGNTFFSALMNIDAAINTKANSDDVNNQIGIISRDIVWDTSELTKYAVGGLGTGYNLQGKTVKEILMLILYGYELIKPTYEEPSITVTVDPAIGVASTPVSITGTITFDRGAILLDGEFQNCRAGKVTGYNIDDGDFQVVSVSGDERVEVINFNYTFTNLPQGQQEATIKIHYAEGAQPVDSFGDVIDAPYPAGTMETTFTVVGLTNTWTGNDSTGENVELNNIEGGIITDTQEDYQLKVGMFEDYDDNGAVIGAGYQTLVPATTFNLDYTEVHAPVVLIPSSLTLYGIKAWSAVHSAFEWYNGSTPEETLVANSFIKSETPVIKYINNQPVEYYVYQYNGNLVIPLMFRFYVIEV